MLSLRKRGQYFHIRGTIRCGQEVRQITEHSTGCRNKSSAKEYQTKLENEIVAEILYGTKGRIKHITFGEAGQLYLQRPEGVSRRNIAILRDLAIYLEHIPLSKINEGWVKFKTDRCQGLAPSSVDRYRGVAMAAINYAAKELDFKAPRLPSIKYKNKRVRWLTIEQRDKLLNSYNKHAKAPITMLCFQGCRTQEALQLQWNDIDLKRKTIYFAKTKNGEPRTIPMHKKVWWMLARMWIKRQKPFEGHVFLSSRGKPYSDTRETESQGGNPLAKAHNTACSKAGIKNFTPHDWRHHWASWCVMSGIDIETIRNMGGWKSLSMLERYAAVSTTHMEEAINKIK